MKQPDERPPRSFSGCCCCCFRAAGSQLVKASGTKCVALQSNWACLPSICSTFCGSTAILRGVATLSLSISLSLYLSLSLTVLASRGRFVDLCGISASAACLIKGVLPNKRSPADITLNRLSCLITQFCLMALGKLFVNFVQLYQPTFLHVYIWSS